MQAHLTIKVFPKFLRLVLRNEYIEASFIVNRGIPYKDLYSKITGKFMSLRFFEDGEDISRIVYGVMSLAVCDALGVKIHDTTYRKFQDKRCCRNCIFLRELPSEDEDRSSKYLPRYICMRDSSLLDNIIRSRQITEKYSLRAAKSQALSLISKELCDSHIFKEYAQKDEVRYNGVINPASVDIKEHNGVKRYICRDYSPIEITVSTEGGKQ